MIFGKRPLKVTAATVLMMGLLAGCGGGAGSGNGGSSDTSGGGAKKEVIKLADVQWQSLWINNAIAGFIMEKGYGYPVQTVEMTTPIMQQSLVKGEVDVAMEVWQGNIIDWYTEVTSKKQILDLGKIMDQGTQGWYVPRYVIEGDASRGIKALAPDLKSVSDLKKYKHLFQDPENPDKGLLVSCITGWECAKVNRIKLHAYGLADDYNIQEPGATAALDAAIAGAYKKGQPILAYYWEPTWLLGTYDMVLLEEPAFNEACEAELKKAQADEIALDKVTATAGCAFRPDTVTKAVHPGLKERAPEVVAFLEQMNVGNEALNKTSAYMEQEKATADKAAIWFFENYQDKWRSWVPADVATKLEAALKEAGAKL